MPRVARAAPADRSAAPLRLDASVAQFRFDEGTRRLKAGVVNDGDRAVRVTQATIAWDGLAFPTVPLSDEPGAARPGRRLHDRVRRAAVRPAARRASRCWSRWWTVAAGGCRCASRTPGCCAGCRRRPAPSSGSTARSRCDLRPADRTARVGGEEYLPADLVLRRRPGARTAVTLVDLGGSVLIDLAPRAAGARCRSGCAADRRALSVPLLLGSAHRCDAHALGQSSQTFLISAYLRLAGRPDAAADPAVDERRARPDHRGRGPGLRRRRRARVSCR